LSNGNNDNNQINLNNELAYTKISDITGNNTLLSVQEIDEELHQPEVPLNAQNFQDSDASERINDLILVISSNFNILKS